VSTARRYEELVCWQLAHQLQNGVFAITDHGPAARDLRYCDQIRDSARSAPSNIAEGFGRFTPGEFRRFLRIARGSLTETHNHLREGHERGYIDHETYQRLSKLAARAAIATGRLMNYLQGCKPPRSHRTS
jgi:four helix bundle protein